MSKPLVPWDFSYGTDEKTLVPNVPCEAGAAMGKEIARMTEPSLKKFRELFPNAPDMCHDCAFRAGSVPNQCAATVADALKSVLELVPFLPSRRCR